MTDPMVGFYVAAAVVTLIQFGRLRDRRLLPLGVFFVFEAVADAFGHWTGPGKTFEVLAGMAALLLLYFLSRHERRSER